MLIPILSMGAVEEPSAIDEQNQSSHMTVLVLLGPPGAGKGTQAKVLSKTLQLPHISTGDLLRTHIKENTELGKEAKAYMDQGQLVPDALILDMLFARVSQEDCQEGYILDGFPRTLDQAQAYDKRLGKETKTIAINLSLDEEVIVHRLGNRLTCQECSTPYHLTFSPPKKEGVCDVCNGLLIKRSDDQEEVIRKRLAVYQNQTAPLIHYYTEQKNLQEVSCDQPIDQVLSEILGHLRLADTKSLSH